MYVTKEWRSKLWFRNATGTKLTKNALLFTNKISVCFSNRIELYHDFTFNWDHKIRLVSLSRCRLQILPSAFVRMSSNQELKSAINARLVQSGEKERLKEHLRLRLIECGWKDQLKLAAKDAIRERGLERVKLEDLVKDITPNGRASVPDSVKRELLVKIKDFLAQQQSF